MRHLVIASNYGVSIYLNLSAQKLASARSMVTNRNSTGYVTYASMIGITLLLKDFLKEVNRATKAAIPVVYCVSPACGGGNTK